jgi:hypothetical protein
MGTYNLMSLLVKNRDAAQRTAGPFGKVTSELRVHGLKERAHERNLQRRSGDRALVDPIAN